MSAPRGQKSRFVVYGLHPMDPVVQGFDFKADARDHAIRTANKFYLPIKIGRRYGSGSDIIYTLEDVIWPNGRRQDG